VEAEVVWAVEVKYLRIALEFGISMPACLAQSGGFEKGKFRCFARSIRLVHETLFWIPGATRVCAGVSQQ
jgi:hypothetical protein